MKFYINEVILWLDNGQIRKVSFEKNKVNVITGRSGTGKSEILSIIDYCLCGSKPDITDEIINDNVLWYGINFIINNKNFTIARGKIVNREISNEFFFSQVGEVPKVPFYNLDEKQIKEILEEEFSITDRTIFPVGGKNIKIGSKISLRYFLIFTTISGNIITDSEVFFDKQNVDRYRDALGTVFDLTLGIETEENLKIKGNINSLKQELKQLKRKQTATNKEMNIFMDSFNDLVKKAKQFNLIDLNELDKSKAINNLLEIAQEYKEENIDLNFNKINKLKKEKNNIIRKIRNLKRFMLEYDEYKNLEKNTLDSLLPIKIIKESHKIFEFPELKLLVNSLNEEYEIIKNYINIKQPFDFNVRKKIIEYENKLIEINKNITDVPISDNSTTNEISKLIFIGEIKAKLQLYGSDSLNENQSKLDKIILEKEEELENISFNLVDYEENKKSILNLLDELIEIYLGQSGDALGNYKDFKSSFNYKEKKLELRRPKSAFTSKVGSSSNHMFLHICLFLGIHDLIIRQKLPYVPQFLILDQPSRPYYGEEEIKKDTIWEDVKDTDKGKITIAMTILNDFISNTVNELKTDFQIILLEHIPESIWNQANLENFHLVEEFRNGNALIRFDESGQPY